MLSKNLDLPDEVWDRLHTESDHELRAALICLLTAALAAQGAATRKQLSEMFAAVRAPRSDS